MVWLDSVPEFDLEPRSVTDLGREQTQLRNTIEYFHKRLGNTAH